MTDILLNVMLVVVTAFVSAVAVFSIILSVVRVVNNTMSDISEILQILREARSKAETQTDQARREPTLNELCRDFRIKLERAQMNRR